MDNRKNDQSFVNREAKRRKAVMFLGGKCDDCSENNPILLDFHHIKMKEKTNEMGQLWSKNWSTILIELKKCQLLCCKCHRIKHYDVKRFNRLEKEILEKINHVEFNSRNRLTNSQKDKIVKLYKSGTKNYRKISKFLKISDCLVKHYLFKCGIYKKGKNKEIESFYAVHKKIITSLYENNVPMEDINKKLKSKYSTCSLVGFINSLLISGDLQRRKNIVPGQIIKEEELINLHNLGKSTEEISKIYNVNKQTVRKRLKKLSLKNLINLKLSTRITH